MVTPLGRYLICKQQTYCEGRKASHSWSRESLSLGSYGEMGQGTERLCCPTGQQEREVLKAPPH